MKARVVKLSLFCFLVFYSAPAFCQTLPPPLHAAYEDVLNLEFESARTKLKSVNQDLLHNPNRLYILNLADAMEAFISDNETIYHEYAAREAARLSEVKQLPEDSPERHFLEAEIRIHWAFVKFRFGHYFKAFLSFRQAYLAASTGSKHFPEYLPLRKSLGVVQTILGSFPEDFNWVLSLAGIRGNIYEGMEALTAVGQSHSFLSTETRVYLAIFQTFLLNQKQEAVNNLNEISKMHRYLTIDLVRAVAMIKNAESKHAQTVLLDLVANGMAGKTPYVYYLIGETFLQENDFTKSITYYQKFISSTKGQNYIKDSYTKLAINYWLAGDEVYRFYLEKARHSGQATLDADKNAAQLIANERFPHQTLLKIRYATDGGFYELAEQQVSQTHVEDFTHEDERLEFIYRKARLYHKTQKIEAALLAYQQVIDRQQNGNLYFAPNSCLETGYIYSSANDAEKALFYFEKAKKYKGHPYKYSIDKKADIEIERLLTNTFNSEAH